eukprot:14324819-Alexandrium_andersonii.AAC.1
MVTRTGLRIASEHDRRVCFATRSGLLTASAPVAFVVLHSRLEAQGGCGHPWLFALCGVCCAVERSCDVDSLEVGSAAGGRQASGFSADLCCYSWIRRAIM